MAPLRDLRLPGRAYSLTGRGFIHEQKHQLVTFNANWRCSLLAGVSSNRTTTCGWPSLHGAWLLAASTLVSTVWQQPQWGVVAVRVLGMLM